MSMINIKQSIMVKPAMETPQQILHLSKLDISFRAPKSHTTVFHIYQRPSSSKSKPNLDVAEILKNALGQILVPFYPIAGRLTMNSNKDRYVIDCNAKGVLFVEAETKHRLDEFDEFVPGAKTRELFIPRCDYNEELSSIPLLMVQLTWFKCGALGVGFAGHHHLADGAANTDFFVKLMRLAGGSSLPVSPIFDRVHLAPREPPCVKFQHSLEFEPIVPSLPSHGLSMSGDEYDTTQSLFKLSKQHLQALKQSTLSHANTKNGHHITTYAVVAGHIWRCVCKARALSYDEEVKLYIPVDGRSRLKDPTIPKEYVGSALFISVCIAKAGDIINKPLSYAATKIQETIHKMDNEYLRSSIDYLELKPGLPEPLFGAHKITYPNLMINLWANLPFYQADFGWGTPKMVGHCEILMEGLSFLSRASDDGTLNLAIHLLSAHMPLFKNYLYSYNFTSLTSSL